VRLTQAIVVGGSENAKGCLQSVEKSKRLARLGKANLIRALLTREQENRNKPIHLESISARTCFAGDLETCSLS